MSSQRFSTERLIKSLTRAHAIENQAGNRQIEFGSGIARTISIEIVAALQI
jgi:hypothetical protein